MSQNLSVTQAIPGSVPRHFTLDGGFLSMSRGIYGSFLAWLVGHVAGIGLRSSVGKPHEGGPIIKPVTPTGPQTLAVELLGGRLEEIDAVGLDHQANDQIKIRVRDLLDDEVICKASTPQALREPHLSPLVNDL